MDIIYINKLFPKQPPEKYYGNKEYKRLFEFNQFFYRKNDKINFNNFQNYSFKNNSFNLTNYIDNLDLVKHFKLDISEFKYNLNDFNYQKFNYTKLNKYLNKKASQMSFRLLEGNGKAIYLFGVEDDGSILGLTHLEIEITFLLFSKIVNLIGATIKKIRIYRTMMDNKFIMSIRIYSNIKIDI